MQPALDKNTLDRLTSLGLKQGHLTTRDLRASLPVESMSAEEIALIVVHLEETGVPVELEDNLISPDPKPVAMPARTAEIIPFPGRSATARNRPKPLPLQPATPASPEPAKPAPVDGSNVHWAIAAAGLLVLTTLGLALYALVG